MSCFIEPNNTYFICDQVSEIDAAVHRMTESQNGRGWK